MFDAGQATACEKKRPCQHQNLHHIYTSTSLFPKSMHVDYDLPYIAHRCTVVSWGVSPSAYMVGTQWPCRRSGHCWNESNCCLHVTLSFLYSKPNFRQDWILHNSNSFGAASAPSLQYVTLGSKSGRAVPLEESLGRQKQSMRSHTAREHTLVVTYPGQQTGGQLLRIYLVLLK